jgi:tRNA threonylcarbamoyladenosine biosynthesis protein TsaE
MRHTLTFTLDTLPQAAQEFVQFMGKQKIVAFYAPMGSGKTTFINALCKSLGSQQASSSPTYSLINEYTTQQGITIYHIDLYRLQSIEEALDIGIEDYLFQADCFIFIEWPEIIKNILPLHTIEVYFETLSSTQRTITIQTHE